MPPPVALHPSSTTSPTAGKQHHGAAPNVPVINDLEDNEVWQRMLEFVFVCVYVCVCVCVCVCVLCVCVCVH